MHKCVATEWLKISTRSTQTHTFRASDGLMEGTISYLWICNLLWTLSSSTVHSLIAIFHLPWPTQVIVCSCFLPSRSEHKYSCHQWQWPQLSNLFHPRNSFCWNQWNYERDHSISFFLTDTTMIIDEGELSRVIQFLIGPKFASDLASPKITTH